MIRRTTFTPSIAGLVLMFACLASHTTAMAQSSIQCTSIIPQITESYNTQSWKQLISLERKFLSYCKGEMRAEEYLDHMGSLATALNEDGQPQEAIGVANSCLQINAADLPCLFEKASALFTLGRISEAKSIIERSLTLGAITETRCRFQKTA